MPRRERTLTTERLAQLHSDDVIKLAGLCRKAGVPYSTVWSAVKRGSELDPDVAAALTAALHATGLRLA